MLPSCLLVVSMVQWSQMALQCCLRHVATLVYAVGKCNMLCPCANYTKYWMSQCSKMAVMNYSTWGLVKLLITVHPHTFHQRIIWISKKIKCSIIWTNVAITEQIFHHQSVKELNVNLEEKKIYIFKKMCLIKIPFEFFVCYYLRGHVIFMLFLSAQVIFM